MKWGLKVAAWEQRGSIKKVCFLQRGAVRRIIRLFPPPQMNTRGLYSCAGRCLFFFFRLGVFRSHQPVTMRRVTLSRIVNKVY